MLGDELDGFAVLALGLDVRDAPGCAFGAGLCRAVAALALDHEAVVDQVGEDVAVHAVGGAGVEGFLGDARTGVEAGELKEFEVGADDDIVRGEEVGVFFVADIAGDGVDFDAGIELLDLGSGCFGALCVLACILSVVQDDVRSCPRRRR